MDKVTSPVRIASLFSVDLRYTHELIHHVTQGEEWELCKALFLAY